MTKAVDMTHNNESVEAVALARWEKMIRAEARGIAERENEASGHCGPYGTETWRDYEQEVRDSFEAIGKAYLAIAATPSSNAHTDLIADWLRKRGDDYIGDRIGPVTVAFREAADALQALHVTASERPVCWIDILREWFGGERYARDYEYLDKNYAEQARRVEAFLNARTALTEDKA